MTDSDDGWVTVFIADNQAMLDQAKAVLDANGIEYSTRNERFPDIPFCGRMVSVSSYTGPPSVQVRTSDEVQSAILLSPLCR